MKKNILVQNYKVEKARTNEKMFVSEKTQKSELCHFLRRFTSSNFPLVELELTRPGQNLMT